MTTIPYVDRWENVKSGFEDIALGVKHRFVDEAKYTPSVAYMVNASIPSGKEVFSTDGKGRRGFYRQQESRACQRAC